MGKKATSRLRESGRLTMDLTHSLQRGQAAQGSDGETHQGELARADQ